MNRYKTTITGLAALLMGAGGLVPSWDMIHAASHREAPITALDRAADITDFYAFRSTEPGAEDKVTFILNVDPLLEPSNGPNYFPFDPDILYAIRIDNTQDAVEDIVFEFRFQTEVRLPGVFTGFVGAGNGLNAPENAPRLADGFRPVGFPVVPPAITALDGSGAEGLSLRQTYTVTLVRGAERTNLARFRTLFAVPSNAGPRTMPDYEALANQGIVNLRNGISVFAGTVDDPFYIDLGAAFDSLNFRPDAFETGVPGVLSDAQDANDGQNSAADDVSGFNVNSIAIEVPIDMIVTGDGLPGANEPRATIGAWGTTSRPRVKVLPNVPGGQPELSNDFVQIQRMGNPLFNELIIGTGSKDAFSMSQPKDDAQFADFALDPLLARVLNAIYRQALPVPDAPRLDLLPLVQYMPPIASPGTPPGPVADLLRVNLGVEPTPTAQQMRLGLLAGDQAGFPNGRRVVDDVTDISTRVVAGVLNPAFNRFPNNRIGDGVNTNDVAYRETFPYVGLAHSGRDSRHVDPGEPGCQGNCP